MVDEYVIDIYLNVVDKIDAPSAIQNTMSYALFNAYFINSYKTTSSSTISSSIKMSLVNNIRYNSKGNPGDMFPSFLKIEGILSSA